MVVNNPNNWHWVDKNCIDWTKKYLNEKLVGMKCTSSSDLGDSIVINSVKFLSGDVEVCQRKGKVISFFDFSIQVTVAGKFKNEDANGTITIQNIAYDSEPYDYIFQVAVKNNSEEEFIKKYLKPQVYEVLTNFGKDLIEAHGNDIQLPEDQVSSTFTLSNQKAAVTGKFLSEKKEVNTNATNSSEKVTSVTPELTSSINGVSRTANKDVPKYNTSSVHLDSFFTTTAEQIYITFLDKSRVAAWTRAPPNIEDKEGTSFQLFNGNIEGKILKLEPFNRIEMLWRLKDWKSGFYTKLIIKLNQLETETKMDVYFEGIPIGEEEKVEDNFKEYYIKAIKLTFGFGLVL